MKKAQPSQLSSGSVPEMDRTATVDTGFMSQKSCFNYLPHTAVGAIRGEIVYLPGVCLAGRPGGHCA
jgi:hypothetical protein